MVGRENRFMDGQLLGQVLNSASFFTSSNLILMAALGGALFGGERTFRTAEALGVIQAPSRLLFEAKLALILLCLARGLLDLIWAIRQINYCIAAIGAVPVNFIRPTFFMENLPGIIARDGAELLVRMPMPGDVPLQMISVRDIGKAAAALLALREPDTAPVEIAGDEVTGERRFYCERPDAILFTENETNFERLFGTPNAHPYVQDAFHSYAVDGRLDAVNPAQVGTKAAAHYVLSLASGETRIFRMRLADIIADGEPFGSSYETAFAARREDADRFYADLTPSGIDADQRNVQRQAFAGRLWGKQSHQYVVR